MLHVIAFRDFAALLDRVPISARDGALTVAGAF